MCALSSSFEKWVTLTESANLGKAIGTAMALVEEHNPVLQGVQPNPYNLALGFCLETLYELLQEKNQDDKLTHVVVECRGKKEDNELELEFRRICDGANRWGKPLPFDVKFADKKVNLAGLQLADLVARPIGLSVLRPEQDNRAFDVLKRKFFCSGGQESVGKGFKNWGLKIYPLPESEKPR